MDRVLLEHVGHFSSLNKKIQKLHDSRAGVVNWNREHFDVLSREGGRTTSYVSRACGDSRSSLFVRLHLSNIGHTGVAFRHVSF